MHIFRLISRIHKPRLLSINLIINIYIYRNKSISIYSIYEKLISYIFKETEYHDIIIVYRYQMMEIREVKFKIYDIATCINNTI